MRTTSKFNQATVTPNLIGSIEAATLKNAEEFNCVRIGIIQTFYPEDLTADVLIANKRVKGLNPDGTQILSDYTPIRAKICYCNPFATYPLKIGDECVLLFSDREIESWFINGNTNPESYPRMHDFTDAVAIVGIRSLPQMITILSDCLHLFYGSSSLELKEGETNINSPTINLSGETININGTLIINGQPYTSHTHSNGNNGSPTGGVIQ